MKKTKLVFTACVLCVCMIFTSSIGAYALTKSEINSKIENYKSKNSKLQQEISKLKKDKNQQGAVLSVLQQKINNTQAIINTYNAEINRINSVIAENKQKIAQTEAEIEDDKRDYRKRIRAIYMSDWDSSLKILLDADSFSEYLQLQRLTEAVSARDKKIVTELSGKIEEIKSANEENQTLLRKQVSLKNEVLEQQNELKSQQADAAKIYNDISKEVSDTSSEISANEKQIAALKKQLEALVVQRGNATQTFVNSSVNSQTGFMWPVPGYYGISSPFGYRRSGFHSGMDISGGGISGRPFVAIADGEVYMANKSWTAAQGRSGYASYGNYCAVNHGTITVNGSSAKYVAFYAHATSIAVSVGQKVTKGQVLGYVGTTGNSTGQHLHIGIQKDGSWINPYYYLR
ncbi:MAG: peptidoglycan DD-metalloendopeptidase family protein [Clostridia bacterium]|nr:peptidoglycan DD-metalloendopeptidase family protein [Clostridia bacterium]